ncbi:MAG: hypothetical protein LBO82_01235 [Synergistaceae bacterium]|jgi:hypothetical protein|nr:hypothetical protein [Synergistaceae bacterium]
MPVEQVEKELFTSESRRADGGSGGAITGIARPWRLPRLRLQLQWP